VGWQHDACALSCMPHSSSCAAAVATTGPCDFDFRISSLKLRVFFKDFSTFNLQLLCSS